MEGNLITFTLPTTVTELHRSRLPHSHVRAVSPPNRVQMQTHVTVLFFFIRIAVWHTHTVESYSTAGRQNV
jgi:hypothetical protein